MRYEAEISLRLVGDKQECQKYVTRARTVLGEVWNRDIETGGLDQSWRRVVLDDRAVVTVYASKLLTPIVTITVAPTKAPPPPEYPWLLRLRWEPEGILLTPTTDDVPGGWGLPMRNPDETGERLPNYTEGGALPQMLLNRFRNNKYHDKPQLLEGLPPYLLGFYPEDYEPPLTRLNYDAPFAAVPDKFVQHRYALRTTQLVSYSEPAPSEEEADNGEYIFRETDYGVGAGALTPGTPVFTVAQELITEPEVADEWFAHRPEELLYSNTAYEFVFQKTNEYRVGAGEDPVHRMLRGESNASEVTVSLLTNEEDGILAHSYYGFVPGLRTTVGRNHAVMGQDVWGFQHNNPNENLFFYTNEPSDVTDQEELGIWVVEQWAESTHHFDNMTSSLWSAEDEYPWHPWYIDGTDQGTKSAALHVGTDFPMTVQQQWVYGGGGEYDYTLEELDPPPTGFLWAQNFIAREAWLPVYSEVRQYDLGPAGTFGSCNPYGRDYYTSSRRVGYHYSIYDMPSGNELNAWDALTDDEDDFQTLLGVAPFEREGKTWLRVVYWKSSEVLETPVDMGDRYGELVVLVFPAGLGDSPILPWRVPNEPEEWEEEFRQRFEEVDGWVPECEGSVKFNNDGTKFLIELEKAGTEFISEGISRDAQVNNIGGSPVTLDDVTTTFYDTYKLFNIQRIPYLYDASIDVVEPGLTRLLEDRVPVQAVVNAGFEDDEEDKFFYDVAINGTYLIWPHFRVDEEGVEDVQWVQLHIDERWYQHSSGVFNGDNTYDPTDPELAATQENKGYRRRIMEFPSGKQIVYMQQYMIQNFAVEWGDITPPGFLGYFPGDGENFYAVIHYLDVENEHVIYSKNGTVTYNKFLNTDPLGSAVPDDMSIPAPNNHSWTRGGSEYILDAFTGVDRHIETIVHFSGEDDPDLRYQDMTERNTAGRHINVTYGLDLYTPGHTPYTIPVLTTFDGGSNWYAYNPQSAIPSAMWSDVSYLGYDGQSAASGEYGLYSFHDSMPVEDYYVTVSTRQSERGEDINTGFRYFEGEAFYGERLSGAYHNVAPMFSRDMECRAKFVTYKDRWIARVEVRHQNRHGLWPLDFASQPKASVSEYVDTYTMNTPPGATAKDGYEPSLQGTREQPSWTKPADGDTAVHLLANFDIDEAVGIGDVTDIQPFGRVG